MLPEIAHVFNLAETIVAETELVTINQDKINMVAELMKDNPLPEKQIDKTKIEEPPEWKRRNIILDELVSDSINYCYWQYNSNIRPNGAGSTKMRELLDISFDARHAMESNMNFNYQIRQFIKTLQRHRFPLMDKRIQHLKALCDPYYSRGASNRSVYITGINVAITFVGMVNDGYKFEHLFDFLITEIDGFGDDPFLKRACLFFIQMNRILGLFEDEIKVFPIPADYQVPKMMHKYELFTYSSLLDAMLRVGSHLRENGPMEMAIRAATVYTGKQLCDITGWSASDVDGWFFSRKNECMDNFHLCQTSNY